MIKYNLNINASAKKEENHILGKSEIAKEILEITAKTALSAIPIGGALMTCVWDSIKNNSVEKRLMEWRNLVEERLNILQCSLEEIGSNENFASAIMKTTEIAIKTAEFKKREYLANAVKNSIETNVNESIMMIYIRMLDEYTTMHIKILAYFANPQKYVDNCEYCMASAMEPLVKAYPEMNDYQDLIGKIVKDLQQDGLLTTGSYMNSTMTQNGMYAKRTTTLGDNFLKFIG